MLHFEGHFSIYMVVMASEHHHSNPIPSLSHRDQKNLNRWAHANACIATDVDLHILQFAICHVS